MEITRSVKKAYNICLGDVLSHPVFGNLEVQGIFEKKGGFDLCCNLSEFNNTMRIFDAMDLIRVKYKRKTRLRLVK